MAFQLAMDTFLEAFLLQLSLSSEALLGYVARADQTIKESQETHPMLARMGSTIVAAIGDGRRPRMIHLGDSRFYWFRGRKGFFQSKDHSVLQTLCDAGIIGPEEIRSRPNRNILLRYLPLLHRRILGSGAGRGWGEESLPGCQRLRLAPVDGGAPATEGIGPRGRRQLYRDRRAGRRERKAMDRFGLRCTGCRTMLHRLTGGTGMGFCCRLDSRNRGVGGRAFLAADRLREASRT
ncbi:PP2C-family Ser/Thr phosphatase [Methylacidimicrobium tartarophylax]|uniref:PP2C-family Ser/Thr phosphatase n=1 Tax=Methylacidimicrobium tartarophylax TaxID=1041768 RepID=A0A5E6M7N0_9BACT|nr:PP2C-family Ser/Thr phosphatase [Methylacidimicrobium tartarophylax]